MTETTESLDTSGPAKSGRARKGEGLSSMVLPDLKALAGQLGIRGTSGMRKGDLVAAIAAKQSTGATSPNKEPRRGDNSGSDNGGAAVDTTGTQPSTNGHSGGDPVLPLGDLSGGRPAAPQDTPASEESSAPRENNRQGGSQQTGTDAADQAQASSERRDGDQRNGDQREGESRGSEDSSSDSDDGQRGNRRNRRGRRDGRDFADNTAGQSGGSGQNNSGQNGATQTAPAGDRRDGQNRDNQGRDNQGRDNQNRDNQNRDNRQGGQNQNRQNADLNNRRDDDDEGDGRGRRGRRYRDRNRRGSRDRFAQDGQAEPEVRDDDVLVPVAGILDVLDSYAFIRTSGYLTGPNDVYVSLSQVRKNGLRRGDAVTGAVRAQRDGEAARQKFNALVRLDSVNGLEPEQAKNRPEFTKLTPLYPNDRLRLETESHLLTTRVIDLVMPVGKGQRALIVSPPKAGKTMVMQAIANAITTNNPECHLMVVLVDERPEEVTDMQRSVKGEVIASTFDRPPSDHTLVAELAIERAKRLVEMGRDVVVLLDSITRLGRAYNLAAPASGRILSGGVDSTALFPPKRFLGAARNIENGGSLTIFASALVETGSAGDTVIFEEFKGTGNAELKLDRRLADKRIFPAIDVDQSSTRKEDLLLSPDELAIVVKLRRVLSALDTQQALELVLDRLRKTRNNVEFLMQVAKNTPGSD